MTNPENFIANTDFATFKNDAKGTLSVTFPGSQVVAGSGGLLSYTADLTLGKAGANIRARGGSSKDSSIQYAVSSVSFNRMGLILGFPAFYSIYANISRVNATTVRLTVFVNNIYSDPLTTEAGDETFTFVVNTFLSPFS